MSKDVQGTNNLVEIRSAKKNKQKQNKQNNNTEASTTILKCLIDQTWSYVQLKCGDCTVSLKQGFLSFKPN